jgi:phage gp29-like protein
MNVFKDGIDYFNRAIMRGLLLPPLVLGGDGGGSYSLGQEHNKIFKQVVDGKLKVYKQNILTQFVKKIIAYNFPKDVWEKDGVGEFAPEDFDPEVMDKMAGIFDKLTTSG